MDTDDDEEAGEQAVAKAKGKGKGKGRPVATAAVPRRTSSRVQKKKSGSSRTSPDGSASAASTLARTHAPTNSTRTTTAEEDDEEDAPRDADATGPGGSLAVLAEARRRRRFLRVLAFRRRTSIKSGVWGVFSPTGYPVAKERVAAMDHTDGKPWEVEVWNMLEDPGGGNEEVNFQSVARYYEQKTRAIMTVPHMGKMKDDELIGIEPHDRMFPTGFYQPKGDFKGTILSCLDLVYCDGADKATPYSEWRGTLHTTVEANTKRFISEICAGYYAKLNTNSKPMKEKTSWAVLYAFRPWGSHFGEPQVAVMEMKEGKMIQGATVKNVNASEIVAIGGLTNSLCDAVTRVAHGQHALLQEHPYGRAIGQRGHCALRSRCRARARGEPGRPEPEEVARALRREHARIHGRVDRQQALPPRHPRRQCAVDQGRGGRGERGDDHDNQEGDHAVRQVVDPPAAPRRRDHLRGH